MAGQTISDEELFSIAFYKERMQNQAEWWTVLISSYIIFAFTWFALMVINPFSTAESGIFRMLEILIYSIIYPFLILFYVVTVLLLLVLFTLIILGGKAHSKKQVDNYKLTGFVDYVVIRIITDILRIGVVIWLASIILGEITKLTLFDQILTTSIEVIVISIFICTYYLLVLQMNRQMEFGLYSKLIWFLISPIVIVISYSSFKSKFTTENLKTSLVFWRMISFYIIFTWVYIIVTMYFQRLLPLPKEILEITILLSILAPTCTFLIGTFYMPEMTLIENKELITVSKIYTTLSKDTEKVERSSSDEIMNYIDYVQKQFSSIEFRRSR